MEKFRVALSADLQHGPRGAGLQGMPVQCLGLVGGEEAFDILDINRQVGDHG